VEEIGVQREAEGSLSLGLGKRKFLKGGRRIKRGPGPLDERQLGRSGAAMEPGGLLEDNGW